MAYGKVIAVYAPQGALVRAYELSDLFTPGEIDGFRHSVSSIWWRKSEGSYVRQGDGTFYVTANDSGAGFVFEIGGAYQYCETRNGNFLCRDSNTARKWRPYREP